MDAIDSQEGATARQMGAEISRTGTIEQGVNQDQVQMYQDMIPVFVPSSRNGSIDPSISHGSINLYPNTRAYKTSKKLKLDSIRQRSRSSSQHQHQQSKQ